MTFLEFLQNKPMQNKKFVFVGKVVAVIVVIASIAVFYLSYNRKNSETSKNSNTSSSINSSKNLPPEKSATLLKETEIVDDKIDEQSDEAFKTQLSSIISNESSDPAN